MTGSEYVRLWSHWAQTEGVVLWFVVFFLFPSFLTLFWRFKLLMMDRARYGYHVFHATMTTWGWFALMAGWTFITGYVAFLGFTFLAVYYFCRLSVKTHNTFEC